MVAAVCNAVSDKCVLQTLLDSAYEEEKNVLQRVVEGEFTNTKQERERILGILSRFDCRYVKCYALQNKFLLRED